MFTYLKGYELPSTAFWGYVSSYKVDYGYNGHQWITYRNSQDLSLNRGFSVRKNALVKVDSIFLASILSPRSLSRQNQAHSVISCCLRSQITVCSLGLEGKT